MQHEKGLLATSARGVRFWYVKDIAVLPLQIFKSDHIDAKRILLVVPLEAQQFLEIRALLLENLGSHQEALECALGPLQPPATTFGFLSATAPFSASDLWPSVEGPPDEGTSLEGSLLCRIYVHQMKDPRLAEAYCDRMYEAAAKEKGQQGGAQMAAWSGLTSQLNYDMYLALIQVTLHLLRIYFDPVIQHLVSEGAFKE